MSKLLMGCINGMHKILKIYFKILFGIGFFVVGTAAIALSELKSE